MRTVARTATKKIAAIKAEFTVCRAYDRSVGEMVPVDPARAWQALEAFRSARLIPYSDGTRYIIRVNGGQFYHLERPHA